MRLGMWTAAALLAVGAAGAAAQTRLGANPSECEISRALLGTAPPGCPPAPVPVPVVPAAPAAPALVQPAAPPPVAAAPAPAPERRASFLINFDFGSARIRPDSRAVLDRVAAVMASGAAGASAFRIVGHTDAVGSDAANLELSRRRAAAVKDYLVRRHGIAAARLETEGRGHREPTDRANPRAPENRRVEIVTLGR